MVQDIVSSCHGRLGTLPYHIELSLQRLEGQLRRLRKHPDIVQEYHQVIKDQLKEHIIEEVDETMNDENQLRYLPHQAVIRTDAENTWLRVVLDASAKLGKHSHSLNDCLHVGPSLTPLMYNVLLRFRLYKVVLIGDIRKAFLQIKVDPSDRDSLRFFWVEDITAEKPEIKKYRFCHVLFRAGPNPFLLNGTLKHHLSKYDSLYVDDLVGGSSDDDQAYDLYQNTKKCLMEGGFEMHKWKSNFGELIKCIEQEEENSKVFDSQEVKPY